MATADRPEIRDDATAPDYAEEVGIYLSWVPPSHAKAAQDALAALRAKLDMLSAVADDALALLDQHISEEQRRELGTFGFSGGDVPNSATERPPENVGPLPRRRAVDTGPEVLVGAVREPAHPPDHEAIRERDQLMGASVMGLV